MVCLISRCPKTCVKKSTSSWAPDAQTVTWWKPDTRDILLYLPRDYIKCNDGAVSIYQDRLLHARLRTDSGLAFSHFRATGIRQCGGPNGARPAGLKGQLTEIVDQRHQRDRQHQGSQHHGPGALLNQAGPDAEHRLRQL